MANQTNTNTALDDLDVFGDDSPAPKTLPNQQVTKPQQQPNNTKIVAPSFVKPHDPKQQPKDAVVPIAVTVARPSKTTYIMSICSIVLAIFCIVLAFISLLI